MINRFELNGEWIARFYEMERGTVYGVGEDADESRYIPAQVPGELHLDACKAGWIQDPYIGTNSLAARWVEECYWIYRKRFEVPREAFDCPNVWLNFDGLDCYAVIYLNGKEVGRHTNTFYPCRIHVAGKLRPGSNLLAVQIDSGLIGAGEKPGIGYTPDNWSTREKLTKRPWLRKPQFQFKWDWAARLVNVGIFKPVSLEWSVDLVRMDQLVVLASLSEDYQQGHVKIRWFGEGLETSERVAKLVVEIPEAEVRVEQEVRIRPGLHPMEAEVRIENPKLWWPVGQGSPERYKVEVSLIVDGSRIDLRTTHIGFRRVVINQDRHPEAGRYFIMEVNGRKVFAKGGNLVPADMILTRLDKARYESLVDRALEANFNILRVWGGGLYESDDLYDLCDEKGILVWQEFIFACGRYPIEDKEFFTSVCEEAVYNIRRLASHPSLVIWCGNNEIECTDWNWDSTQGVLHSDHTLYHVTLPRLLAQEDGTRVYLPSSPYSPDFQHPDATDCGDQHHWQIGVRDVDFRNYRKLDCRFLDEAGVLGPSSLATVQACLPEGQAHMNSLSWLMHDNAVGNSVEPSPPEEMLRFWLGLEPRRMSLEQYVYWGGLIHGEALRELCENLRWRMFGNAAAILWMYNDCWPVVRSWTIVDYYQRRTPGFHPVRRALSPIHLILVEQNEEIVTYGVNDTPEPVMASLRHGIFTLGGKYLYNIASEATLLPGASTRLASIPASLWRDRKASIPFAKLMESGKLIARGRLFSELYKDMKWANVEIRTTLHNKRAYFECDSYAWNVCLDLNGEVKLEDNFFDLFPGEAYSIAWEGEVPPQIQFVGNSLTEIQKQIPINLAREVRSVIPFV